jgi:hypothetical protein
MGDDKTRSLNRLGPSAAKPVNNSVDAQCVTEADPGEFPKAGDSGNIFKLVSGDRIHHEGGNLITPLPPSFVGKGSGQSTSKI